MLIRKVFALPRDILPRHRDPQTEIVRVLLWLTGNLTRLVSNAYLRLAGTYPLMIPPNLGLQFGLC
jgi:hypothetical protein